MPKRGYKQTEEHKRRNRLRGLTHGMSGTKIHRIWIDMKQRCYNLNNKDYKNYGGRGITVCDRWRGRYGFIYFIRDMGVCPEGFLLDRIDNDGSYEPGNCRWTDYKISNRNSRTRKNIKLSWEKVKEIRALKEKGLTQKEIAKQFGVGQAHISDVVNNKIWN